MTIDFLYLFVEWCSKIMHKKFQVNLTKIEDVMAIFVISLITFNSKAWGQRPTAGPKGPPAEGGGR